MTYLPPETSTLGDVEQQPEGSTRSVRAGSTQPATRPPRRKKPTQYERVMKVLLENDEVCGHATFYGEMFIPRFSVAIHDARRAGSCDRHRHEGVAYLYRLEALPYDPTGGG